MLKFTLIQILIMVIKKIEAHKKIARPDHLHQATWQVLINRQTSTTILTTHPIKTENRSLKFVQLFQKVHNFWVITKLVALKII